MKRSCNWVSRLARAVMFTGVWAVGLVAIVGSGGGGGTQPAGGGTPPPSVAITQSPQDTTVLAGLTATFSATGTNVASWQWQSSPNGTGAWSDIAGANLSSYTTPALTPQASGSRYRVRASGSAGDLALSEVATLTVNLPPAAPVITAQPLNRVALPGGSATFSVAATGSALTYAWRGSADGISWADIPSATGATYTVTGAGEAGGNLHFQVLVSNNLGSVLSIEARLLIATLPSPPRVSGPFDYATTPGSAATFRVTLQGAPTPQLQWQKSSNAGANWTDIPGANTDALLLPWVSESDNQMRVRVLATNSSGSAQGQATLTVAPGQAPVFTREPAGGVVPINGSLLLSAGASGVPTPTLTWQMGRPPAEPFVDVRTNVTELATGPMGLDRSGTQWRVVATNSVGSTVSQAAVVTVQGALPSVRIDQGAALNPLANGQMVTLSATASGDPVPTLQWSMSTDGGSTYNAIPGATAGTLAIGPIQVGFVGRYRVTALSTAGEASAAIVVTAVQPPFALVSATPADQSTGVSQTGTLVLTFNAPVNPGSVVDGTVFVATATGVVPRTATVNGNAVTLTFARRLAPRELHTVTVRSVLQDTAARALARDLTLRFTTSGLTWQGSEDIGFIGCTGGRHKLALLDDDSAVVACTADGGPPNVATAWLRNATGQWSALAQAPTPTAGMIDLHKLSGSQVALVWYDPQGAGGAGETLVRTWDTATGMGPLRSRPRLGELLSSLGSDRLLIQIRSQPSQPFGPAAVEMIDLDTAAVITSFQTESGRAGQNGFNASCRMPDGSRMLVYATTAQSGAGFSFNIWATAYERVLGWLPPRQLGQTTGSNLYLRAACGTGLVARAFWWSIGQTGNVLEARFADLDGITWSAARETSTTPTQLPTAADTVQTALESANSGSGWVSWSDLRSDAAGSVGGIGSDRFASVPRTFIQRRGERRFSEDSEMPFGRSVSGIDTAVRRVAFNPASGRYVMAVYGGLVASPRWLLTEFDVLGSWTQPWLLAPGHLSLSVLQMDFNSRGKGLAIGAGAGQMVLSEWR